MSKNVFRSTAVIILVAAVVLASAFPAAAGSYDQALKGVDQVKALFEVTQASPQVANIVFWAVKNVYEEEAVKGLSAPPQMVVVFHGPVVKLISSDMSGFKPEEVKEIGKFQDTIRAMAKDGVRFEVCDYALKVMGVDPAKVLPEINHVPNGFVSVLGYQAQGYSHVLVP